MILCYRCLLHSKQNSLCFAQSDIFFRTMQQYPDEIPGCLHSLMILVLQTYGRVRHTMSKLHGIRQGKVLVHETFW